MSGYFTLAYDGIILNSVGEVLVEDPKTDTVRARCRSHYIRALEDLAFGIVYGTKITSTSNFRGSEDQRMQPGDEVIKLLGNVFEPHRFPVEFHGGGLLRQERYRSAIKNDVKNLVEISNSSLWLRPFRDWIVREAAKYLGSDESLVDPEATNYGFDAAQPYYRDEGIENLIDKNFVDSLRQHLPKSPPKGRRPYTERALDAFVRRNALTYITIMWEYHHICQVERYWRMPHAGRAILREVSATRTQAQSRLRNLVARHALSSALQGSASYNRQELIEAVLNFRGTSPFKEVRAILADEDLMILEPLPAKEEAANKWLAQISNLTHGDDVVDSARLTANYTLREFQGRQDELERQVVRVFPDLDPTHTRTANITMGDTRNFNAPIASYVEGNAGEITAHQEVATYQTVNDLSVIREIVAELSKRGGEIHLANDERKALDETVAGLTRLLREEKPEASALSAGIATLRRILEHVPSVVIAHGVLNWLPPLVEKLKALCS